MISVITPTIRPEGLKVVQECLEKQTFQDFEWLVEVGLPSVRHDLSQSLNRMLKRAKGEIVVMWQDYIQAPENALEHIANTYDGTFKTYPVGKVLKWGDEPVWDWRKANQKYIKPEEWEADFASAPLKAFFDIGGYDETFDNGWSWENVNLAWRSKMAGYDFKCDNTLYVIALDHDALMEHPFRNSKEPNGDYANKTVEEALNGNWKLNYL